MAKRKISAFTILTCCNMASSSYLSAAWGLVLVLAGGLVFVGGLVLPGGLIFPDELVVRSVPVLTLVLTGGLFFVLTVS